jgi:hypothetical protein
LNMAHLYDLPLKMVTFDSYVKLWLFSDLVLGFL